MPTLTAGETEIAPVEDWRTDEDRKLTFTLEQAGGSARDSEDFAPEWYLVKRPYTDPATEGNILDDGSTGVTIDDPDGNNWDAQNRTMSASDNFRVTVEQNTISAAGEWGRLYQVVQIKFLPSLDDDAWAGPVVTTAGGAPP